MEFQAYQGSVPACASIHISLQHYPDSLLSAMVADLGLEGHSQEQGEGQKGAVATPSPPAAAAPVHVDLGGQLQGQCSRGDATQTDPNLL